VTLHDLEQHLGLGVVTLEFLVVLRAIPSTSKMMA
jgi:hypothetical protein